MLGKSSGNYPSEEIMFWPGIKHGPSQWQGEGAGIYRGGVFVSLHGT
jgi:hypothetical protein